MVMNKEYKIINPNNWIRKNVYNWFITFPNPTYGFNSNIDITNF